MPETTAKAKTTPSQGVDTPKATKAPPKKIGRPSKYTPELAAEIAQRISMGEPLRKICRDEHMPHWTVMYDWLAQDEALSLRVARAREAGYEALAEEALEIADERPEVNEFRDKNTGEVLNIDLSSAYIAWQRNRVDTRLKLLACWSPAKYGNKVQMGGDPKNPLKIEVKTEAEQSLAELLKHAELKRQAANAE